MIDYGNLQKALKHLEVQYIKIILALLQKYLPDTTVWAYGSRVRGTARPHSDLDLVAFATPPQQGAIADLQEAFDESDLPFRVDLLVWHELPEQFHQTIAADYAVVQQATDYRGGVGPRDGVRLHTLIHREPLYRHSLPITPALSRHQPQRGVRLPDFYLICRIGVLNGNFPPITSQTSLPLHVLSLFLVMGQSSFDSQILLTKVQNCCEPLAFSHVDLDHILGKPLVSTTNLLGHGVRKNMEFTSFKCGNNTFCD